jgi:hypothetical protein
VNDLHDLAVRERTKVKLVSLSRGPAGTGVLIAIVNGFIRVFFSSSFFDRFT